MKKLFTVALLLAAAAIVIPVHFGVNSISVNKPVALADGAGSPVPPLPLLFDGAGSPVPPLRL